MSRPCTRCTKAVFPLDDKISAEGGIWHKACFKCTACNGQLTLLSFAQIKGRGKYDDLAGGATTHTHTHTHEDTHTGSASPAPQAEDAAAGGADAAGVTATATGSVPAGAAADEAAAAAPGESADAADAGETFISGLSVKERIAAMKQAPTAAPAPAPAPAPSPPAAEPAPAPAPEPAAEAAPAGAEPAAETFISGLSVKERIAAMKAAEAAAAAAAASAAPSRRGSVLPQAAPAKSAGTSGLRASPLAPTPEHAAVAAHSADKPAETFISGRSVKERIALAASGRSASPSAGAEDAPAAAVSTQQVHSSPVASTVVSPPHTEAAAPAAAPQDAAAAAKKPAKVLGLGGGSVKCASCGKSVYPADPQIGNDGSVWHRECFKCSHCKGQLNIKGMAVFEGQLFCKPHFVALFKLKGKYDTLKGGDAAADAGTAATEESVPASEDSPAGEPPAIAAAAE